MRAVVPVSGTVSADPVVLPVVEYRQEHVDVRQHLVEPLRRLEGDVLVRALGVDIVGLGLDLVAEGTEEVIDQGLAAPAGGRREGS